MHGTSVLAGLLQGMYPHILFVPLKQIFFCKKVKRIIEQI